MDCHNWIGCQEDCENCILMSMDQADQVQAWDVETMQQWSPEDILKLLQSFGRKAKNAEERGLQQIKLQRQEVQERNKYKAENERLREALEAAVSYVPDLKDVPGIKAALEGGEEDTDN